MILRKIIKGAIALIRSRPDYPVVRQFSLRFFLFYFIPTPLYQLHHHKTWQDDLFVVRQAIKPLNRWQVLA